MKSKKKREQKIKSEIERILEMVSREALRQLDETLRVEVVSRDDAKPKVRISLNKRRHAVPVTRCFMLTEDDWKEVFKLPLSGMLVGLVKELHRRRDSPPDYHEYINGRRTSYWFNNLNGFFCKNDAPFRIKILTPYRRGGAGPVQIVRTDDRSSAE